MRRTVKILAQTAFLVLVSPCAVACGFGRIETLFAFFAQTLSLVPGLIGNYARVAFYHMTLRSCSRDCRIEFGTFFAHPQVTVEKSVAIGPRCIIGYAVIREGALIGPGAQILSGGAQHARDSQGRLTDEGRRFTEVTIGKHCWIGASSVILADIGDRTTVAAGSVVLTPVGEGMLVGGNPAEVWWNARRKSRSTTA